PAGWPRSKKTPHSSSVFLSLGFFLTTCTSMSVSGVILFSTLGSLLGAIILYYIGKLLNKERLMRIVSGKIGRLLHLNAANIENAAIWFENKGCKAVFFCRLVPILRSLISIPAGMSEMNQVKFLLYTTAGSLLWNTVLVVLGSLLGESWVFIAIVLKRYSTITKIALGISALSAILYFYQKKRS
ncbi:MAG: DedA family protein, partial [Lachnospiraceae bacterium]|nr:DedA family protein [Lachnospiraceae bacterium]